MSLYEQLQIVEENIEKACIKSGRNREDVTLIAVSKTKPVSMLLEAMEAGVCVFGENKVQELKSKVQFINGAQEEVYASLVVSQEDVARRDKLFFGTRTAENCGQDVADSNNAEKVEEKNKVTSGYRLQNILSVDDIRWHLIGTLQTNKVKYLPPLTGLTMIHSVDNLKLAEEIEARYQSYEEGNVLSAYKPGIDVLIEVNMAHEETKMGLSPADVQTLITQIAPFEHIRVRGLMTIAPETDNAESNRVYFAGLRELMEQINQKGILSQPMTKLSMGMTGDYTVAIEEGATFVRVGTGIFGARDYSK